MIDKRLDAKQMFEHGIVLVRLGRLEDAIKSFDRATVLAPGFAEAFFYRGSALLGVRRTADAIADFDRAIRLKPNFTEAYYNRAHAKTLLGRIKDAVCDYDGAIAQRPDFVEAISNRGDALLALDRPLEALADYDRAVKLRPGLAEALCKRGNALLRLKRVPEAIADYDQAIALKPNFAEAFNNRGNARFELKNIVSAIADYDRAVALRPRFVDALCNRGNALLVSGRAEDAVQSFNRALVLDPRLCHAFYSRGNALLRLKRTAEALASYDEAVALDPNHAEAFCSRGVAQRRLGQATQSIASFDKAVALKPGYAEAFLGRGNILAELQRYEEALGAYDQARFLDSNMPYLESARLQAKMHICDWRNFAEDCAKLTAHVSESVTSEAPFALLPISSSLGQQRRCAERYVRDKFPPCSKPLWHGEIYRHEKIRIAYLSGAFRDHPTSALIAGLFEMHDRSRFETVGISYSPDDSSQVRRRLELGFDRFIDVCDKGDGEVAAILRDSEIDIAVDLDGLIDVSRTGVLAHRPAPVQVNYLGYPGTMGADYVDYIIADRIVISDDQRTQFREKVVYLPNTYQPNTGRNPLRPTPSRELCGLPRDGFVFCCFNNSYKITPDIFEVWMRLLQKAEGSVLWLLSANPSAGANLAREAENRGIGSERLIFAPRATADIHLARQQLADLFLDTPYYNAHTTASDALWAGLPVVTLLGSTFSGRVAASLLNAIGLTELITHSWQDYEDLALKLAMNPTLLSDIKAKLHRNSAHYPLFDAGRMTRALERAYELMWQRYQADKPPQSFLVEPQL